MGGISNEYLNRWKWRGGSFQRRWPMRLVDREGLVALIEAVQGSSPELPTVTFDSGESGFKTIDQVFEKMPRRVLSVSIYGGSVSLDMTTKRSGVTAATAWGDSQALNRIAARLEDHGRRVSLWSRLFWWVPLAREQTVATSRRRADVETSSEARRNATIGAVAGVLSGVASGVIAAIATVAASTP